MRGGGGGGAERARGAEEGLREAEWEMGEGMVGIGVCERKEVEGERGMGRGGSGSGVVHSKNI